VVPARGLEPRTLGLKDRCSNQAELRRLITIFGVLASRLVAGPGVSRPESGYGCPVEVMKSPGGFRFLPIDGPFSAGVAAELGYQIVRAIAPRYTPLAAGFRMIEKTLEAERRPIGAFCAMELRIPKPLSREAFDTFNVGYVAQLQRWGLAVDGYQPAARSNVAPQIAPPDQPSVHAFCYTVEGAGQRDTFVISGAPEPPGTQGGPSVFWASITAILEERMNALGVDWTDATETQLYGTREDHELFAANGLARFEELVRPGLRWFFARPPIDSLKLEIDVRGLARESWL
jgi:hypothetical protein